MSIPGVTQSSFHASTAYLQHNQPAKTFHQKIQSYRENTRTAWEKLKANFVKKDEITLLLEQGNFENPEDLAPYLLTVNPFSYKGHLLKQFLKTADPDFMKTLLDEVFNQFFENSDLCFEKILPFFETEQLESLADEEDVSEKIAEMAKYLPDAIEVKQSIPAQISKTLQVVWRFFPNFLDTALKAFNLINAGKVPETIWDFSAMLEIYFKIFLIPHSIFMIIGKIVSVPLSAYLISAAIVLALVIATCVYIKYRPCPDQLPRAHNFTEMAENDEFDPVVSRDNEIQLVSSYLGRKEESLFTNLLLVGEPGVGKTELVKGIAQQYQDKKIFGLNAPELSSGYTPITDIMRLIFLDIKGHENEVLFFIDELGDAIKKNPSANIGGYLKPLLCGRGVQVIAAVTNKEYEEEILKDDALASRFQVIHMEPTDQEKTIAILEKRMDIKGMNVRFTQGIEKTVYELTKDKMQPRHSVQLLDLAINKVNAFDIKKYVPADLVNARAAFAQKQKTYERACNMRSNAASKLAEELEGLEASLQEMEESNAKCISTALKVRQLIHKQRVLQRRRNELAKKQPSDNKELIYLNWALLPWIESKINAIIDELPPEIPMQINKQLIETILGA